MEEVDLSCNDIMAVTFNEEKLCISTILKETLRHEQQYQMDECDNTTGNSINTTAWM